MKRKRGRDGGRAWRAVMRVARRDGGSDAAATWCQLMFYILFFLFVFCVVFESYGEIGM